MRILFVAYCIASPDGDSLIGVFKRCLRIAMELSRRGDEAVIFCRGREHYRDDLTTQAEKQCQVLDLPFGVLQSKPQEVKRRFYRLLFSSLRLDRIVIGEAPLAGTLLDSTLCGIELGIPVIILDNAYNPGLSQLFLDVHGPIADGIVLTSPSSFHISNPPAHVCQVPPYCEKSPEAARALLDKLGLLGTRLVTVLGYESKAQKLAASLLLQTSDLGCEAVFITPDSEACNTTLSSLPTELRERIRIIQPPPDPTLFGLLELSKLAVGKCGFMQVTECLALRTPIIGIYYQGCFSPSLLPDPARSFVHGTSNVEPDVETISEARRFLQTSSDQLSSIHNGEFGALAKVADFILNLPHAQRSGTCSESAKLGYTRALLTKALASKHPGCAIDIQMVRCTRLRNLQSSRIDSLVCLYTVGSERRRAFLWGRSYDTPGAAKEDLTAAQKTGSQRCLLYGSVEDRILIEVDIGERFLPPLII